MRLLEHVAEAPKGCLDGCASFGQIDEHVIRSVRGPYRISRIRYAVSRIWPYRMVSNMVRPYPVYGVTVSVSGPGKKPRIRRIRVVYRVHLLTAQRLHLADPTCKCRSIVPARHTQCPFGLVLTPYRSLKEGDPPVPLIRDTVIARCHRCRSYINPFVQFVDGGKRWRCTLCTMSNEVMQMFDWTRSATSWATAGHARSSTMAPSSTSCRRNTWCARRSRCSTASSST